MRAHSRLRPPSADPGPRRRRPARPPLRQRPRSRARGRPPAHRARRARRDHDRVRRRHAGWPHPQRVNRVWTAAPMRARALRGREAPTTAPPPFCSPFVAAFVAFALAQCLKVVTFYVAEGRWDATRLVGSGGMVRGREEGGSARARGQHPFPPPRFPALVPHRRRGRAGRLHRSDARHGVRGVCDLRGAVPGRGRRHPAPAPNPEIPDPNPTPQPARSSRPSSRTTRPASASPPGGMRRC